MGSVFREGFADGALDELVGRQAGIAHLIGAFATRHRQAARIQQPHLNQHRGLIPIDVLVRNLAFAAADDRHQCHLDPFAVGAMPGNIQSIGTVWVDSKIISSTICVSPIVEEIGVVFVSGGICGMKQRV